MSAQKEIAVKQMSDASDRTPKSVTGIRKKLTQVTAMGRKTLEVNESRRFTRSAEDLSSIKSAESEESPSPLPQHRSPFGLRGLFNRKRDCDVVTPTIEISPNNLSLERHPVSYAANIHSPPERPNAFNRVLHQIRSQPVMLQRASESKLLSALRTRSDGSDNDNAKEDVRRKKKGSSLPRDAELRKRAQSASITSDPKYDNSEFLLKLDVDSAIGPLSNYGSDIDDNDLGVSPDPQRTKDVIEHVLDKIKKTKELIKNEQVVKDDNVTEYLKLSNQADKIQQQRIKTVFEKKNQKSNATIVLLQRKLENYHKRLMVVKTSGAVGPRKPKEVFHGMQQGLRGVRDNIKVGITEFSGAVVAKPKEIAHKFKNKFGSADNLDSDDEEETDLPHKSGRSNWFAALPTMDSPIKSGSEGEESSSIDNVEDGHVVLREDMDEHPLVARMSILQDRISELTSSEALLRMKLDELREQNREQYQYISQTMSDELFRIQRLEEQLNDLTDLHNNAQSNTHQELSSLEEWVRYTVGEIERDIQDRFDQSDTKVSKIELAQQHQQVITLEGYENPNTRAIISKLINLALSLLAVLLLFISTIANIVSPFICTRLRLLLSIITSFLLFNMWQNFDSIVENYKHLFYINQWT